MEEPSIEDRPPWVIDDNTYELWRRGADESMFPGDVVFSEATVAQIKRMLEYAASEVALFKEAEAEAEAAPPQPQPQLPAAAPPLQPLPEAAAGSAASWAGSVMWPKFEVSDATRALAKSLAAGPRVGASPATVMGA